MKKQHMRSMRDIPTIQGLHDHSVPTTREQAVTELARLEHEKARLKRELDTWLSNQKKTEERLQLVDERLTRLQEILQPPAADEATSRNTRPQAAKRTDGTAEGTGGWREISIEY